MKFRLAPILILLPCFLPAAAWGGSGMKPYRIDSWQVDDGLPQSSVTSIVQTHDGYLWLGTFGGLARFDGVKFKVFKPSNAPHLPSSRILCLFGDQRGRLWIGTEEGFLAQYADGEFHSRSPPGWAKLSGYIRGFAESSDRSLWLVSPQDELMRFSADQRFVSPTNSELLQTNVNAIAGDSRGEVWTCTGKRIGFWENSRFIEMLTLQQNDESSPAVLAGSLRGGCWVAADGRLRKFTRDGCVADYGVFPWSKGNVVRMLEDHSGQIWVGTYGSGLYSYDTNGTSRHFSTEDGLPGGFIRSLAEDREGNIWVGTDGYGLARVKPVIFQSYGRKQGLSGDAVSSVCEGEDGELWIGMIGDGLDRMKDGVIQHYGTAQGLPNDYVWSVFYDRSRTLWVGTWGGGLCRLEGNRFVPFANPGECSGIVCALYEDSKGGLWVGQQRSKSGIVRVRDGKPHVLDLQSRFAGTDVRAIVEDGDSFWIGTQGDGLYRIQHGAQSRFDRRNGLSNEYIRSLHVDEEDTLWIGTYGGGLNRFKDGKFTGFTSREGLVHDELGFITEDDHGNLWCSSQRGIFRVSKSELNRFAEGKSSWIRCLPFTKSDGLPSLECTGGSQPSGCRTRDGRLWFPTVRGLAVVDPANITVNELPPPVAIEEVVTEGKERSSVFDVANSSRAGGASAPLKIATGVQRLEFHYTALSLTEPMKVRFKYRLEGVEEHWVEAGARRAVSYTYLQPGPYRFVVQACNNDGIWNETGAALSLIVLPHFWQTWWFRALCLTSVVALLVGVYEMRLLAERKLTRLRLRIASDLHDEVGSNLGSIALLSEMIQRTGDEVNEIRRVALQTVNSLRDIVWFLDPAADNMSELVLRLKETARTMLAGVPFDFVSEGETRSIRPSLHLRRNILPMFKEILHNIAKHSRAKRVVIAIEVASQRFQISVTDDGVGFEESRVRRGNGLKNLRRRTADLGGTLQIQSQPGAGARFTFSAPIT